jgi:uncharacterized protein YaaW (UPF0174 family)
MQSILAKCEPADLAQISRFLDSYVSLTDDKKRKRLLALSETDPDSKDELLTLMDKQIRYYGSSDIAYVKRQIMGEEPGVSTEELIADVCSKLKIKIKMGGSVETLLERVVTATVERELASKSPEELSEAFEKMGVAEKQRRILLEKMRSEGKALLIPLIFQILGEKVALKIIQEVIVALLGSIIGKQAAGEIMKQIMKKMPGGAALGPLLWVISGIWLGFDLQTTAFRKTIPIVLYLGIVALRDGREGQSLEEQEAEDDKEP